MGLRTIVTGFLAITSFSEAFAIDKNCIDAIKSAQHLEKQGATDVLAASLNPRRKLFFGNKEMKLTENAYVFLSGLEDALRLEVIGQKTNLPFEFANLFPDLKLRLEKIAKEKHETTAALSENSIRAREASQAITHETGGGGAPYNPMRAAEFGQPGIVDFYNSEEGAGEKVAGLLKNEKTLNQKLTNLQSQKAAVYREIWNRFLDGIPVRKAYNEIQAVAEAEAEVAAQKARNDEFKRIEDIRTRIATLDLLRRAYEKILASLEASNPEGVEQLRQMAAEVKLSGGLNPSLVAKNRVMLNGIFNQLSREYAPSGTPKSVVSDALIYFSLNGTTQDSSAWPNDSLNAYPIRPEIREVFRNIVSNVSFELDSITLARRDTLPSDMEQILRLYPGRRAVTGGHDRAIRKYLIALYDAVRTYGFSVDESVSRVSKYLKETYGMPEREAMDRFIYNATEGRVSRYPARAAGYLFKQTARAAAVVGLMTGAIWVTPHVSEFLYNHDVPYAVPEEIARERIDSVRAPIETWAWNTYGEAGNEALSNAYDYVAQGLSTTGEALKAQIPVHFEKPMP